ncbi:TetR/AcrR family transcriptional regulator [Paraclostridium ghonii]|uniref:Dihydroxyacetone kinase regulator n=1 Tax=Paraclostridium ghonii TaxID=29358 RepID=A0ABU0N1A7_9FIRM|nr:TetR/AcrR family transcriptional regulator C-terminal domain-containing protein [Paeniclostridium ghonii]MDQ0556949.1 putative dihydroxyacetone kinase regulator [Paeniclostridium ghonii]
MSQITKKALASSLKKLMNTRSLSKITINDIVQECGVNRRTFYYHFKDIYDLVEWILKNEINEKIKENITFETWQQSFLKILNYLSENKKMIYNIYNSIDLNQLEIHVHRAVYKLVFNVVNDLCEEINISEREKEFVLNYYKISLTGLLLDWIKNKMEENPEQIIKNLNKIVNGDIHKLLLTCESI